MSQLPMQQGKLLSSESDSIYGPVHAKTCLMSYANNKVISTLVVRCLGSIVSVAEQAGLNLTWSKISEDTFSRDVAQLCIYIQSRSSTIGRETKIAVSLCVEKRGNPTRVQGRFHTVKILKFRTPENLL